MRTALPDRARAAGVAVSLPELRSVVAHVRALEAEATRTSRARYWTYALFLAILAGSLRAAPVCAYLFSSPFPQVEENRMRALKNLGVVSAIAVSSATVTSSAVGQDAVQWRVEDGGNGHWYARVPVSEGVLWSIAAAHATAAGGHLVSITSPAENALLVARGAQPSDLLGANTPPAQGCVPTAWSWQSGEPWNYTNWAESEPTLCDETALVFAISQFPKWNNYYGGSTGYWIEWSADCNGDGIVDFGQIRAGDLVDLDADNIPDCCASPLGCCPADIDQSGATNGVDLAAILNNWGTSGGKQPRSDVNRDGLVDGSDLAEVLNAWGPCP